MTSSGMRSGRSGIRLERLLRSGLVVVATIRRSELEAGMPKGDLHNPFGEALTDTELVVEVPWPVIWNDQERAARQPST